MNILGIGPAELLLVFIIALIVFGPGKLPELARTLGKAMRDLRRMSLEVTAEFAKELRDMEAVSREVKETTETIKQAADIKSTLVESLELALPSTDSGHRTGGESREEPRISDVQETTSQAEAEKKDTVGDEETSTRAATMMKENETEDHE
ncbi:MAG: twin-arginine translocase subunit TatB [Anaerolineales bacterium]|nr:MAG: twin-arginine translocase subunit TatB [Anaerolineales bacterium]